MEAEVFPRKANAIDKSIYRAEFQRVEVELAGNLPDHAGIFRSGGIGVFLDIFVRVALKLTDNPAGNKLHLCIAGGEVEERASKHKGRAGNTHVDFFRSALMELACVVTELSAADDAVVAEEDLLALEHIHIVDELHLGDEVSHALVGWHE